MADPMIKKWEFTFDEEWRSGAKGMIIAITNFICNDSKLDTMEISDPVFIVGNVFDKSGFRDGDKISTSNIVRLEKIPASEKFSDLLKYGNCGKRFIATTASGSRYELVELGADGMSAGQFLMTKAIIRDNGQKSTSPF